MAALAIAAVGAKAVVVTVSTAAAVKAKAAVVSCVYQRRGCVISDGRAP